MAMELPLRVASVNDLREAVVLACQASYVPRILRGRAGVLSAPRTWILAHVEQIAEDAIDWDDEWDYRRLLELYALLDPRLLPRAIEKGLTSHNPEVAEAAEEFRDPAYVESIRASFTIGLTQVDPELGGIDPRESNRHDGEP
jgi:hypothetical protein